MFEFFEHTADLGIRVRALDLHELFAEAALALFSAILEDPTKVQSLKEVEIVLEADGYDYLLFDWLNGLLYRFETEHMVFGSFEVCIRNRRLQGVACGEPLDRSRHALSHEVKAITYHGLRAEQTPGGWLAEVIVDI
jgi:SHS2 domain-containing protein